MLGIEAEGLQGARREGVCFAAGILVLPAREQDDERIDRIKVVDQLEGPQQLLPVITQFQAADTPEKLDQFLSRLRAYPAFMAANTELLHEGLLTGMTASRISTERTIAQLERILAVAPEESVIVQTARVANDADREKVLAAVRESVYPADEQFLEGLRGEYLHASREEPGLWSAPNGLIGAGIRHFRAQRPRARGVVGGARSRLCLAAPRGSWSR